MYLLNEGHILGVPFKCRHWFHSSIINEEIQNSVETLKKLFFNVYFWERDRTRGERCRERGRRRIWSRLQALSCQHRAWHGAGTHEPRDHDLSWSWTLNWLSHPGPPYGNFRHEKHQKCSWPPKLTKKNEIGICEFQFLICFMNTWDLDFLP